MDLKSVIASLLLFWAASVIAPPSLWYSLAEDGITITLNTGEEEPGEPQGADTWEEKIVCSHGVPRLEAHGAPKASVPFPLALQAYAIAREVILPPPEAFRA